MKIFLVPLTAAALLFTAGIASAEEATGRLEAFSPDQGTIILEDGSTYSLAEGVQLPDLQPGMEVRVSFEQDAEGKNVAYDIQPTQ